MSLVSRQIGLLASHRLDGVYKFENTFQLLPSAFKSEMLMQDHPLVLEICFDSNVWPYREKGVWYRDQWEQDRYEHLTKNFSATPSDSKTRWLEAYQKNTETRRFGAVIHELVNLLTLFSNHSFSYSNTISQSWFIQPGSGEKVPLWGQKCYSFDEYEQGTELSTPNTASVPLVPYQEYFSMIKGAIYAGGENVITLPDNMDHLLGLYFSTHGQKKESFYKACHLYCKALDLATESASLSLISSVMAIEALINADSDRSNPCDTCGTPAPLENCASCGAPVYRATSKFKRFVTEHTTESDEMRRFANKLYHTRSRLAHGGLLRDDLHDSGFYANAKEEEEQLRRSARDTTRIVLVNWLLRNGSETAT